ncbi:hypothetical protein [Quadrisphaera sp. DSM 44207]|uniref:hypothetical protein n=1 Tax=Quadrisphaera sp. DSM 44207 TaxID=1881057 RepID=UPI0008837BAF|nr:hypothetical protein [Quadrisphaera sp. DSM 44207]SDQ40173.1 hypothetical protein SAMN05428996_1558 [Quadrisphaera sp. DSM 44207]
MTTIKASCPTCGDVELTPPQVRLVVCTVQAWSFYAFACPACTDEVRKHASEEVVRLLTTGGVPAETWVVPAEVLEEKLGPVVGWDEVLDFALWLERTDAVAAAAADAVLRPRHLA